VKEITDALLRKADRSIAVAKKLFPSEADFAAARAYYAMFYIASGMPGDYKFHRHFRIADYSCVFRVAENNRSSSAGQTGFAIWHIGKQ
jgi:uncharacterized protein (UPF0332 family)